MALPFITPRKTEVQAVVEILTSEDYETPEIMAKAVIKTAYQEMLKRDWWAAGHPGARQMDKETGERSGAPIPVLFGPYPTDSFAVKAIADGRAAAGPDGKAGIFRLFSIAYAESVADKADGVDEPKEICQHCHHIKATHDWPRVRGCAVVNCPCMRYQEKK